MRSGSFAGLGIAAFLLAGGMALAAEDDGAAMLPGISPLDVRLGSYVLHVGGAAQGALSQSFQPASYGLAKSLVSGAASVTAGLERESDSGVVWGVKSAFQLWHDRLAGDNYGSDLVQKVYGQVQTGLGTVEVGMNDGAAFALSATGPVVDGEASLDNANVSFFRDPVSRGAFVSQFSLSSAVEPSFNYAKFSYYTPKLFGLQAGVSYTPSVAKYVLPFADTAPRAPGRQTGLWETAVQYDDSLGPFSVSLSGAAGFAHADAATRMADGQGLTDWAVGGEIGYPLSEEAMLRLGGAYRHANSYSFDIQSVYSDGATHSAHLSAKVEQGAWSFGLEYGNGATRAPAAGAPALAVTGYEAALGYTLNANWLISTGWQQLRYSRDRGFFYNGDPHIRLNALFLHLHFQVL